MPSRKYRIAAASAGLALLAACGSAGNGGTAGSPSSAASIPTAAGPPAATGGAPASTSGGIAADHNDADVLFAQNMMPHHSQAVALADGVLIDGSDPAVQALARNIRGEHAAQIVLMNSMLQAWGEPPAGHQGYADMADLPGMASEAELALFYRSSGPELDRMFLTLMIKHHNGAEQMALAEQAAGLNPQAVALARAVAVSQLTERTDLEALLG
jgi:uncharacterized protein (DUF305 family)